MKKNRTYRNKKHNVYDKNTLDRINGRSDIREKSELEQQQNSNRNHFKLNTENKELKKNKGKSVRC